MNKLLDQVREAVISEHNRAAQLHGPAHASHHEAYAVILEEYCEAKDAKNAFMDCFQTYWDGVRHDNVSRCNIANMQHYAMQAAAEWVQVAAMCKKAVAKKVNSDDT